MGWVLIRAGVYCPHLWAQLVVNWTLRNKLQWNLNQNTWLFIHQNASEDAVCKMAAILSRGRRWVKACVFSLWERLHEAWWHQDMFSICCLMSCEPDLNQWPQELTLLLLTLEYTVKIRPIQWLLMTWLLVSPEHQQLWHWLCKINRSLSSKRNDIYWLCHFCDKKW